MSSGLFAKSSNNSASADASTRSVVTLQQEESGRFDKLRNTLSHMFQSSPKKQAPSDDYHRPVINIPAESINLSQSQESMLKDEAFARGGFINHLSADYDLHSQCPLPPLQARFESGFIYMPDEELVAKITLELQREYPHLHMEKEAAPTPSSSAAPVHSVSLKQGQFIDVQRANQDAPRLQPQPRPQAHLLPQAPQYHSKKIELNSDDAPNFNHHTDYYHLAADYDIHTRSHLPPRQARFESNIIYMPDEALVKKFCSELQHEYPHLRPAHDAGKESRFTFRFW
jgi:hypothetical protein